MRAESRDEKVLLRRLRRVLALLERVEPESSEGDVRWAGPFFIPRRGEWWPTRFLRYQNELYCSVELGRSTVTLVWAVDESEIRFEGETQWDFAYCNGAELWQRVLEQVEHRLRSAVANPAAYNKRIARLLPLSSRTGRILRKFTWPRDAHSPMSSAELARLASALERGMREQLLQRMHLRRYLQVAAVAYDAVLPELRAHAPRKKYERKADSRHGGLLALRPTDAQAFERWYESREWSGSHPWEIVFAHPHGILLSPHHEAGGWRFFLSVDTLGLYIDTARMAIALGEGGIPFELIRAEEVTAALRGEDWVEVGPFYDQIAVDELRTRRSDALANVQWDRPAQFATRADVHGRETLSK